MKFFKKILHKYILKSHIQSVQLRGRLSDKDQIFLDNKKGKEYLTIKQITEKVTKSKKNVYLEIGFGNGSHIVNLAKQNQDTLIVGSEMYLAGVVNTLKSAEKNSCHNLYTTSEDARLLLCKIDNDRLQQIYILFPDPWPKARHNKRRLLKEKFFDLLLKKIKKGGQIIIATDWPEYANEVAELVQKIELEGVGEISNLEKEKEVPIYQTTFATRAKKEGREIAIFVLTKL